jgi:plasmid stabilization system protein ParE
MKEFVLHPEAYRDIEEIWQYIAADTLAADRIVEEFYRNIRKLAPFPNRRHSRPDLTSGPLRFLAVRDYVIVYAPDEEPLVVIAVLHGRRNPRVISAILRERE